MDEESPPATPEPTDKDPFNISNDEYYLPKTTENSIKIGSASGLLQHSIPVVGAVWRRGGCIQLEAYDLPATPVVTPAVTSADLCPCLGPQV